MQRHGNMKGRAGPEVGLQIRLTLVLFFHVNNFTLIPFNLDLGIEEVLSVLCISMHNTINRQMKHLQYLERVCAITERSGTQLNQIKMEELTVLIQKQEPRVRDQIWKTDHVIVC